MVIYNLSFSSGCVPDQFKLAQVIPIHKKESVTCLSNYRPISLLSIFNKILESLVNKRLLSFLNKHDILFQNQFGFRTKHSTMHAALSITDKVQKSIEEGQYSCGIFLDFSKAFDTVDHKILLQKLRNYGIRGIALDWFASYLSNRRQFVTIGNTSSDVRSLSHGVPQGSVLGPLLFLIYINDFNRSSTFFDFHIFADDSNLFLSNHSIFELERLANDNLYLVSNWLRANKLSLNIEKTNFIIFHPPQKKLSYTPKLTISNKRIKQENYVKYLGLYIDSSLSWKFHVQHIAKKVKRCAGILSKIRYYVTKDILVQLYYALVYPFLAYSLITWGNTYSTTLKPLTILQKRIARIINFADFNAHSSPIFANLGILKLEDLIFLDNALFMHDYYSNQLPSVFSNFFKSVSEVHHYNTRLASKNKYYLPKARTNYGKFNIRFSGTKVWNSLEDDIKSMNRYLFKKNLKLFLLSKY